MSRTTWIGTLRALGDAVFDLVRAEVAALLEDWRRAAVELAKVVGIALAVLLICFYLPFLVLFALVDGIAAWWDWPMWGAALAVFGFAVLVIAVLGGVAAWIWKRRLVGPTVSWQRRLDAHGDWWQRRVYLEREAVESAGDGWQDSNGDDR